MRELILLDGEPIEENFPIRSLFYGEGVFETFRRKATLPVFWNRHILRMKKGAEVLGIPFPGVENIKETVEKAVLDSQISDAYVKMCLLSRGASIFYENPRGSSFFTIVREYQFPREPIKAHISSFRRNSTSPILRLKSLNYLENIFARREARGLGFDESIFLNERGEVTEGSAANIFWLKGGVLFTPSLECGLLSGVIRDVVIELAGEMGIQVKEGSFDLDNLTSSQMARPGSSHLSSMQALQGVFFTNSLIGVVPVSQIDGFKPPLDSQDFKRIKTALLEKLGWI